MDSRIWISEYGEGDDALRRQAAEFPLQLPEGWEEGIRWRKSRQHIQAWLLLSRAVKECFGYSLDELDIRRDAGGKPWSAAHPEIKFNLSHCQEACACIVGSVEVGIDAERKFKCREGLMRRVCHAREYEKLEQMEDEMRQAQFRFLWSMKESFVKMDGRGLGYGMDRVNCASLLPVRLSPGESCVKECGSVTFWIQDQERYTLAACEINNRCESGGSFTDQ